MYLKLINVNTGWIKQHYIVSSVNSPSFQQSCSDLLRSLVQLRACGCAHCYPLQAKQEMSVSVVKRYQEFISLLGIVCMTFALRSI